VSFGTLGDKLKLSNQVTPQMRAKVEASLARANLDKKDDTTVPTLANDIRARFKIEVTFDKDRTVQGPNLLGIQVWESGKRLHGGGDELCFFCKDAKEDLGCWGIIPPDAVKGGVAYCPHCEKAVNSVRLTTMKVGRVTTQNLATELEKMWRQLGCNADIYLKYHKTDIRYVSMERAMGPGAARKLKGMHIYTLSNILKDTSAGAEVHSRFVAFLSS